MTGIPRAGTPKAGATATMAGIPRTGTPKAGATGAGASKVATEPIGAMRGGATLQKTAGVSSRLGTRGAMTLATKTGGMSPRIPPRSQNCGSRQVGTKLCSAKPQLTCQPHARPRLASYGKAAQRYHRVPLQGQWKSRFWMRQWRMKSSRMSRK